MVGDLTFFPGFVEFFVSLFNGFYFSLDNEDSVKCMIFN